MHASVITSQGNQTENSPPKKIPKLSDFLTIDSTQFENINKSRKLKQKETREMAQHKNYYLRRLNFLEVLDNGYDAISDFGFVKESAPDLLGEVALDEVRQAADTRSRVSKREGRVYAHS